MAEQRSAMAPQPTRDDKFSFGLWTVGWNGTDPFGDATRPPLDPVEAVEKLAELGAYGLTFHDDDLFAFGSDDAERDAADRPLQGRPRRDRPHRRRWSPPTCSRHPVFKDGGFTSQRPRRAPLRAAQGDPQPRPRPPSSAPRPSSCGAAARAPSTTRAKDIRAALERYREGVDLLGDYVTDKGYDIRFAIEPKPNEPRGDILLPTRRPRARVHRHARARPTSSASTPRSATSRWPA